MANTSQPSHGPDALEPQSRAVQAHLMGGLALACVGVGLTTMLLVGGGTERKAEGLERAWAGGAGPPAARAAARPSRPAARPPTYIRIGGPAPEPDPVELALKALRGPI